MAASGATTTAGASWTTDMIEAPRTPSRSKAQTSRAIHTAHSATAKAR